MAFETHELRRRVRVSSTAKKINEWIMEKAEVTRTTSRQIEKVVVIVIWTYSTGTQGDNGIRSGGGEIAHCR